MANNNSKKLNISMFDVININKGIQSVGDLPLPIGISFDLSQVYQNIESHLKSYDQALTKLNHRFQVSKVLKDKNGYESTVQIIDPERMSEYNEELEKLRGKTVELTLPTFKLVDFGYNDKKPNEKSKYDIPSSFFKNMYHLISKK